MDIFKASPQSLVQEGTPWPLFRNDSRNTGRSLLKGIYTGDMPWAFSTGKGVFSTPVVDVQGVIYVGSADHWFYAINPDGSLGWKFETGEIIDSAAALGPFSADKGYATVTFISGDGRMYQLRTGDGIEDARQRLLWTYEAELRPGVSYNRWFEGNVAVGPDGTLYAGNTNFNYYAIRPDGSLKWTYSTGSNNWSQAAFGEDGTIYWGSVDTFVRAVSPQGKELWKRRTLGFVAASAAVGSDGTVYIGSFDSFLYALEPRNGKMKWKFSTGDHIYCSAALGADAQGNTTAIYFGSTDGVFYALLPDGRLKWKLAVGDPIRSSPVIGLDANGEEILYFGAGDGRLYALNAADGSLRWAFDTTPDDPELRDRNDLNGSPALGKTGVYIGGEHGQVWYVPYDYPLHANAKGLQNNWGLRDGDEDGAFLRYMTPGGSVLDEFPEMLPAATQITLRLAVRRAGQPVDARLCNLPRLLFGLVGCPPDALEVRAEPDFPMVVEHSADGKYIYIRPQGFLSPGTVYQLKVSGRYYTGGAQIGNLRLGGRQAGRFAQQFSFRVAPAQARRLPLEMGEDQVGALEWTRLALPLPPMLPSLNQIGFDYMDWIMGVAALQPQGERDGKFVVWAIGGKRDDRGQRVADPSSDFTLPLNGYYQEDAFILTNRDFTMDVTGIPIPFNLFELRGCLAADGVVRPGATVWADTRALSIPTFGPYLVIGGLANNIYEKLLVLGTYITRPYNGPANRRPAGVNVVHIEYRAPTRTQDGLARATFHLAEGASCPGNQHRPGLLLLDLLRTEAIYLDYHAGLKSLVDGQGNLSGVELRIPAGKILPARLRVTALLDVFPLASREF